MAQNLDQLVVQLSADISGLRANLNTATSDIKAFTHTADKASADFQASTSKMGVAFGVAAAAVVAGTAKILKSAFDTGMQMQALENKMAAATGSVYAAADSMRFVAGESDRLGLSFVDTANSFANFSASALRSGLSLDQTQQVFIGVAEAATALHLSTDQTNSAFLALEQMASKGTISMQELRLQLANAIPGALEYMAQALGVSTQKLNDMVQKGELLASDALPKLGEELHRQFGQRAVASADSAQAATNRLSNAIVNLKAEMANSGVLNAFTIVIEDMTAALNNPAVVKGFTAIAHGLSQIILLAARAAEMVGAFTARMTGAQAAGAMNRGNGKLASTGEGLFADISGNNVVTAAGGGHSGGGAAKGGRARSDSTKSQIEQLKFQLASETQQLQMEYEKRQKLLEEALKKKHITEKEYRELGFQSELEYKQKFGELWAKQAEERRQQEEEVASAIRSIRAGIVDSSIGLLQTLGQKNKAFAIAAIALEKAIGIAEVLIASRVAAAKAIAIYGPTPQGFAAAAMATNFGYIQAGLIAATGLVEAAQMGGGGNGASSGSSDNFADGVGTTVNGVANAQAQQPKVINLTITGSRFTPSDYRDFAEKLTEFVGDGTIRLNVGQAA